MLVEKINLLDFPVYCLSYAIRRWYILLVSFAILPLTLDLSLGCQFIVVGSATDDQAQLKNQALGLFNAAVYDDTDGNFLGCVDFSNALTQQTNYDVGFKFSRYAGGFLMAFSIMATLVCICTQCFMKSGKSFLWMVMRFSYAGACLCQGAVYVIFTSELCTSFEGADSRCSLGRNGVAGVFNFALLLGMVIATCFSYPPRHPVFQCWYSDPDGSVDEIYTDHDEDESHKGRGIEVGRSPNTSASASVSLFGNSRASRSVKSTHSVKSASVVKSSSRTGSTSSRPVSGSQSVKKSESRSTTTKDETKTSKGSASDKVDKYSAAELGTLREKDRMGTSMYQDGTPAGLELTMGEGDLTSAENEKQAGDPVTTTRSMAGSASVTGSILSAASRLWNRSRSKSISSDNQSGQSSFKGVSKRITKIETDIKAGRATPVIPKDVLLSPGRSNINPREVPNPEARPKSYPIDLEDSESIRLLRQLAVVSKVPDSEARPKSNSVDNEDSESIRFLRQLAKVTKLGLGGTRVKTTEEDHRIEMVDKYPAKAVEAPRSSDGADVVRVRTEYYDQGSRTTKEVTHHDGSRTVITIIDSKGSGSSDNDQSTASDSISKKSTNSEPMKESRNDSQTETGLVKVGSRASSKSDSTKSTSNSKSSKQSSSKKM